MKTEWSNRWRRSPIQVAVGLLVILMLLVSGGVWANQMVTPVTREGEPTAAVTPLPVYTPPTPTTTVPATENTPGPKPTATPPTKKPKPAKTPKPTDEFNTATKAVAALSSSGKLREFAVQVETSTKLNANAAGVQMAEVLNDPRSWTGSGEVRFGLIAKPKSADFTMKIATTKTLTKQCQGKAGVVCVSGKTIWIDFGKWQVPPAAFNNATQWQTYLVNHGVGAWNGEKPAKCAKKGKSAPIMMDQSGGLAGCKANPWPYP